MNTSVYDVIQYGAKGDGVSLCTAFLQAAIDKAAENGGGEVHFPSGRYLTGTLYLKSNVSLYLHSGAVLLGSTNIKDYAVDTGFNLYRDEPHMDRCLIFADHAENIGLYGFGQIDGQGYPKHFPDDPGLKIRPHRPMMMRFIECKGIKLRDLTLKNAAAWCVAVIWSQDIVAEGLTIENAVNHNGDGLDFDGCCNVRISNCSFKTSDDCICLQTSRADKPCFNIVIQNCILSSKWAGFRFGLLSCGNISDVTVSNCIVYDTLCSGIKIQMCEGAVMENLLFNGIIMRNVVRPIFATLNSYRFSKIAPDSLPPTGMLRRLHFNNFVISADKTSCLPQKSSIVLVGTPGYCIEDVALNNIRFSVPGGCVKIDSQDRPVPELAGKRPEHSELGDHFPSYGIYARHVNKLSLNHIHLDYRDEDDRPAVVCDDVSHLEISSLIAQSGLEFQTITKLYNVKDAVIFNCQSFMLQKAM